MVFYVVFVCDWTTLKVGSGRPTTDYRQLAMPVCERHERYGVERQPIGRRVAGDMSVPASD